MKTKLFVLMLLIAAFTAPMTNAGGLDFLLQLMTPITNTPITNTRTPITNPRTPITNPKTPITNKPDHVVHHPITISG